MQPSRARRVEALIEFLSELIGEEKPTRRRARELLVGVYARHCLEPITGTSTRSAFERELAVAYVLAEEGLGWSDELEKLSPAFAKERVCSGALGPVLEGASLADALGRAGAKPSRAWVAALLGYARALHYLGYLGDYELAELFKALARAGADAELLRFNRKLVASHKLAQLIASGSITDRRAKENKKRVLALLFGGGREDKPSDALVWRIAVNVYGIKEREALKLLSVGRASLLHAVTRAASPWYCFVAPYRELEETVSRLDPLWQQAYGVAAARVGALIPAAGIPIALALLEQAVAEGLDPDGFVAKLEESLRTGGDPIELLLSWGVGGWKPSILPLPSHSFEVRLVRKHEMIVFDRVPAEEALEAGVRRAAERLRAKLEEAVTTARLRGKVAERWLRAVALLLALEVFGRACEIGPAPAEHRRPAGTLAERAKVGDAEIAVEIVRRRGRKYLAASISGKRVVAVRFGDLKRAAEKVARALDKNLPKSVKPEVKAEFQRLLQKLVERAAKELGGGTQG